MAASNVAPTFVDMNGQVLGIYGDMFTKSHNQFNFIVRKLNCERNTTSVSTMPNYGVISHIPRNPYLNGKQVSNNKCLNQPTVIHLSNF